MDEEQDEAYKQEDRLRYNARDLALLRGREQSCPVILGTATPSAVSYHGAHSGRLGRITMPRRVRGVAMPKVEVVDLRIAGRLRHGFLSPALHLALEQTLKQGKQAMLFLNRRGFAPALICPSCGKTVGCPACSLSLTLHKNAKRLTCHTCGHTQASAGKMPLVRGGRGQNEAPGAGHRGGGRKAGRGISPRQAVPPGSGHRIQRQKAGQFSKGHRRPPGGHHRGTQMITKGHHFPGLALVGVLLADQALAAPDFKSAERAYVLLTQVAGRAGREGGPGRVLVQTYDPDHHAVRAAVSHQPEEFYRVEMEQRKALFSTRPLPAWPGSRSKAPTPKRPGPLPPIWPVV